MHDVDRLTIDAFLDWHTHVDGRYELVDGRIVPHPDYVTPQGFAAPSNAHGRILANLAIALGRSMPSHCRVYVGVAVEIDDRNGNIPDLAISCAQSDALGKKLTRPRVIVEILSPSTRRLDSGRKVDDYTSLASVETYLTIDPDARVATVYSRGDAPETFRTGTIVCASDISFELESCFL